jgi:hypothetical protein
MIFLVSFNNRIISKTDLYDMESSSLHKTIKYQSKNMMTLKNFSWFQRNVKILKRLAIVNKTLSTFAFLSKQLDELLNLYKKVVPQFQEFRDQTVWNGMICVIYHLFCLQ